MEIVQIGSPYFGYPDQTHGRNGYKPITVCMHIAEGTLGGCDSWFNSPGNQGSSTHYCIGKNGEIHQYVDETDSAWGNGQVKKPTWPLLIEGVNPNLYTVSIEHEGHTGEPWTEEMFQADLWLLREIAGRWGIPFDKDHIIGHYRIDGVNRPNCPGTGLPWDRLFIELNKAVPVADQVAQLQRRVAELQAKLASIGRLVKTDSGSEVYLIKSGMLYPLADQLTLERLYAQALVETVSASDIVSLPRGNAIAV